jgi:hypothetical protein
MLQLHLLTVAIILCYAALQQVMGLPVGFVDEGVGTLNGPNKAIFAPNPRNLRGPPMMIVAAKEGQIVAFEDPDNSDISIPIANMYISPSRFRDESISIYILHKFYHQLSH